MDYELPENLRLMRDTARRFVKNELESISQQVEAMNNAEIEKPQSRPCWYSGTCYSLHPFSFYPSPCFVL